MRYSVGISSPSGFSEQLQRETADNAQYAGNIGSMQWRNAVNGELHKYDYTYDGLGRLTDSQYSSSVNGTDGRFDESLTYNRNGSITSLLRSGMRNDGTFGVIDDLSVNYDGNRLLNVTDDAESLNYNGALDFNDGADMTAEYEYDSTGALTKDRNRGITGITYDLSHNPQTIVMNGGQIVNDYTSDGRKLCSTQSTGMTTTTDMYVDGLIIRNGAPLMWQFNGGYVSLGANSVPQSWNYYITDHLGSTRMVVDSRNIIKETINYYPYGSEMTMTPPAQLTSNPNWQPYRFTGKELVRQNGLNMYDFGARWYDVAGVPVWTSMDPLCEKNYPVTPYSYCNGDPVNAIDPDGKKIVIANGSSTKFIQQYETTVNHLKNYGCGDFIDILEKSDVQYIIKENMGNSNYFDYASHEISWNPTMGLNTDFTILSPATRLNHEFDHAVQYENNPTKYKNDIKPLDDKNPHSLYNTEDDYRVITGSEQKTAEALGEIKTGEVTRMGHYGKPVETISPISNTPINKIEEFEIIGKQKQ